MPLSHRLLALFLLVSSLPAASLAQGAMVWTEKSSGSFVTLAYGPLDPQKKPLFMLSCFNSIGIAVLNVHAELAEAKSGTPLTIELAGGGLSTPVEAEAANDPANGETFGEAGDVKVRPILDVLREDGPVTIKVGDVKAELSEQDRAEAIEQFEKDCTLS